MNVLFICHANVCRSFMAQEILRHLCPGVSVRSRGVYVDALCEVPDKVKSFLISKGITPTAHQPAQLAGEDLAWADLVLFMEERHLSHTLDKYAQYTDKCYLLREYSFEETADMPDPIGLSGRSFVKQAEKLYQVVAACAAHIMQNRAPQNDGCFTKMI